MFENTLIVVDLDGTLLDDDSKIPEKNLKAIDEFRASGGLFTIATGRAISYTRAIALELKVDIPTIVYNGGMVYDFNKDEILWQAALPRKALDYMLNFYDKFPTLGIDVMKGENIYTISRNFQSKRHEAKIGVPTISCDIEGLPHDGWDKILIMDEKEVIDSLFEYSGEIEHEGVHITRSSPYYFEVLPENANKGNGLRKLLELCGFNEHYIVSAGDFNNDIEMLQAADLAFAVENAVEEVKNHADVIVCENNSGAIYEIVEILKSRNQK